MDKINRIHIAKVPYDIEISAQSGLKKYLDEIEACLDADMAEEIMTDIEGRITEILNERGVKRDGVITVRDVRAIEEQLGSPEQFTDKEHEDKQKQTNGAHPKMLLRDMDTALIGGVASGFGAYFNVDPIIIRILFIILTLASGFGVLLYILLWLLVPPAKTNSDKLLMRGEKVTAAALQRYRGTAQRTLANLRFRTAFELVYKIFRVLFSLAVAMIILALLASSGIATAVLYTQPLHPLFIAYHPNYVLLGLVWLLIMAAIGLMVVLLLCLWRQRSFSLKIVFVVIAGALILSLAGLATVTPFVVDHYNHKYGDNRLIVAVPVHNDTPAVSATSLNILADSNLHASYVVTNQPLHATYQALPGMGQPHLSIVTKNGIITFQANQLEQVVPNCVLNWCSHIYLPIRVTIYGPALQKFNVDGGALLSIDNIIQSNLTLASEEGSELDIDNSYSNNLSLTATSEASIFASDTSAKVSDISVQNGSNIDGPASNTVNITLPESCDDPLLSLDQPPASITLNGRQITTQDLSQNNCITLDYQSPEPPAFEN